MFLTRAAYERTSRMEAARSGDCPPSGSDEMLDGSELPSGALLLAGRRKRWEREFVMGRIVLVLGGRLRNPDASSRVRRPLAAESSSESLAVASVIADGVEEAVLKLNRGYVEEEGVDKEDINSITRPVTRPHINSVTRPHSGTRPKDYGLLPVNGCTFPFKRSHLPVNGCTFLDNIFTTRYDHEFE